MSESYLYYQVQGGEDVWTACPLRFVANVRKTTKPAFMTVLAVSEIVDDQVTPEVLERLKHAGPFYMDWDSGEDITLAIEDTRQTLVNLVEKHQLDPRCVEIYATGGKGFHLIVPHEVFMVKMPPAGIRDLHKIYKGMAYALATDTLDFRVYSGRRGRMWREANIQRSNGRYKVPITFDELMVMDEEMYIDLTSQPRYYAEPDSIAQGDKRYIPQPIKPVPSLGLTIIFDKSRTDVENSNKKKRNKVNDVKALAKWGDSPPPSFQMILEGKGLKKGQGFNAIAMQVVITAQEMGWSCEKLLEQATGLCQLHQSDGRNNSFEKRQGELQRLYEYCNDYIYEFSVPGLRSLIEFDSPDLDGIVSEAIKTEVAKAAEAADSGEPKPSQDEGVDDLTRAVEMRREGIYVIDEDSRRLVSTIAFVNPKVRISANTGKLQEVEAEIYADGKRRGTEIVPIGTFESKHFFGKFAASWGSVFFGNDQNAASIMRKLRLNATQGKDGKIIHTVPREGLDWVCLPNHENELLRKLFPVFVDHRGVHLPDHIAATGVELGYSSDFSPGGIYQSDLMRAPDVMEYVKENPQSVEIMRGLLTCQKKKVLSKILGWYCAAYYRMFFDKANCYGKFPLLHVFGQAGSGKTEMNELMLRFHYHTAEPRVLTPSSSLYALRINVTASASIPLVIDEYKVSDMKEKYYPLSNMLKAAYNNREFQMGGGNSDSADKRSLSSANLSAPIVYISEACEEMTALQERSILIPVSRAPEPLNSVWRKRFEAAKANYEILSALGRYMCTKICNLSLAEFVEAFDPVKQEAEKVLLEASNEGGLAIQRQSREAFNYAVVKFGLMSLQRACQNVFGTALDTELNDLIAEVYTGVTDSAVRVMSEINKFINGLSQMAQVHDSYSAAHLARGIHYEIFEYAGKNALEINLTACVDRYLRDNQAKGLTPLFKDANIIMGSLKEHAGLLKDKPEKLAMHCNRGVVLDLDYLLSQGIEPFPDK